MSDPKQPPYSVFLGVPCYSSIIPQALPGLMHATYRYRWVLHQEVGSLLCRGFNKLVVACLNTRDQVQWTHFAMHHADVEAPPGWIDTLIEEMNRVNADIISVVLPIKDARGLTSTGLLVDGRVRRLAMREIMALPETFSRRDVSDDDRDVILINTGLWVARMHVIGNALLFNEVNHIIRHDNGRYEAVTVPEDWGFSSWAAEQQYSVYATRKVKCNHHGSQPYPNHVAWGTQATDEGDPGQ